MLAIDCGNTRIKWARCGSAERSETRYAEFGKPETLNALADDLGHAVERVLVANVAGERVAAQVADIVADAAGIEAEFVQVSPAAHGITCGYREPRALGVDRWLAMVAVRQTTAEPFIVISAGTAVTIDVVDRNGAHLGGLILPGDKLMIDAIAANTGQIPVVARADEPVSGLGLLGRTTEDAVGRGTRLAVAAAIDRAILSVNNTLGSAAKVIVTGGDRQSVSNWLASSHSLQPDLVLEGLAVIGKELE